MDTKLILNHVMSRDLDLILLGEDIRDFDKAQVEEDFSFSSLEVGSFEVE